MAKVNVTAIVLPFVEAGISGICNNQSCRRSYQQKDQREVPSDRLEEWSDSNRASMENFLLIDSLTQKLPSTGIFLSKTNSLSLLFSFYQSFSLSIFVFLHQRFSRKIDCNFELLVAQI